MKRKTSWWMSVRVVLARMLCVPVEVEARYGAHRTRHRQTWDGDLVFVDIPLQTKKCATDTPFGRVAGGQEQQIIDDITALGPWDPFSDAAKVERFKACPFCGHTEEAK